MPTPTRPRSLPRLPVRTRSVALVVGLIACGSALPAGAMGIAAWQTGSTPWPVTLDAAGNVYTGNTASNSITKLTPLGMPVDPLGAAALTWAPTGTTPRGIVTDSAGNVYVANANSGTVTKVSPDGTSLTGPGMASGVWATPGIAPQGMALDAAGNLYVANSGSDSIVKVAPDGVPATGPGMPAGVWASLPGAAPVAVASDASGTVVVGTSNGTITRLGGDGRALWTIASAPGFQNRAITMDWAGNAYAAGFDASPGNDIITKVTAAGSLVTGPGMADGVWAITADAPNGLTIDSSGNVFVTINSGNSVEKVTADGGVAQHVASTGTLPHGIAIDASANLYTADSNDDRVTRIVPGVDTANADDIAPAPPAVPGTPSAAAADASANVSVPVNAVDARHGAPTAYVVEAVGDASRTCTIAPPANTCTVTGLTNGTGYSFTARARLNAWTTAASAASPAVTPTGQPAPVDPPASRPGARSIATRLVANRRGTVVIPLACPAGDSPCRVAGTLSAAVPTAAPRAMSTRVVARFRGAIIGPGRSARVAARLSPTALRAYRRAGTRRMGATLATGTVFGDGARAGRRQRVLLVFPRLVMPPVTG